MTEICANFYVSSSQHIFQSFLQQWSTNRDYFKTVLNKIYTEILLKYTPSNGTLFFGNNIISKMGILNLYFKNIFKPKNPNQNYVFEVCIRFHKCCDRMEF